MYMYCSCLLFGNKTMLIIIYSSCSCECIIENIFQITKYDVMLLLMLRAEKKIDVKSYIVTMLEKARKDKFLDSHFHYAFIQSPLLTHTHRTLFTRYF